MNCRELVVKDEPCQFPKGNHGSIVSVIIPVLDNQYGLDLLLDALASQSWNSRSLEVIVIDNGSKQPIEIREAHSGFTSLAKCDGRGAYAARNAGVAVANGEILAFTDADCIPDPTWVEQGVKALREGLGRRVVGGDVELQLSGNPTAIELYQCITGFSQRENICKRGFSATANLFVTRSQFEIVGWFDESLLSGGDREWCWRAAKCGFRIEYLASVRVITEPRKSIREAIKQARRVAGGRFMLKRGDVRHVSEKGLGPGRRLFEAAFWILKHPELSIRDRARVFAVASVLKGVQLLEECRLRMGFRPERR